MRCTKWNPWWTPDEETPIAIAWISFPELPPNFFGKESDESGPEEFKWIRIQYDYMPKYCKPCKKQGHSEAECWVIHPELHKRFDEDVEDQGKDKIIVVSTEAIGTTANSTKVLSSGKEADKGKGKAKLEEVATKNKFNALEVEEVHQPILQITEGKGEDLSNVKKKDHGENQSKKGYEKEKEGNTGASSPNPNSGVMVGKDANTKPVEKIINKNISANKESTIDWVHRRFGTSKEELRQLNVTTNQSCQDMSSQTFADSGQLENLDEINSTKAGGSDAIEVEDDQI
ncbi:hypothetical protein A4A49_57056, partial [Nicotiana attenuata]